MVVFRNTQETMQGIVDILIKKLKDVNMVCNKEKTKTIIEGDESAKNYVERKIIQQVNTFEK